MKSGAQTQPARIASWMFAALIAMNAGVLLVLLCGPNAPHPILPLAYGGAALALAGLVVLVRSIIVRRRNAPFPPPKPHE